LPFLSQEFLLYWREGQALQRHRDVCTSPPLYLLIQFFLFLHSLPLTGLSSNMSTLSAQTPQTSSSTGATSDSAETPSTTKRQPQFKKSDLYGECSNPLDASQLDEKKVQEALKKLTKQTADKEDPSSSSSSSQKKRGYNSMSTADVTPEEMEAYRRIKVQREDPMAKFLDSDELLEG
jgi:hypothetical protein